MAGTAGALLAPALLALGTPGATAGPPPSGTSPSTAVVRAAEDGSFEPRTGVTFNDPTTRRTSQVLLRQVVRSIEETEAGEEIRIATWNFDDGPALRALVEAAERGVAVGVVVSARVDNDSYRALAEALNGDDSADTSAVQCSGGCRSRTRIMHAKVFLFSRVGTARHVSMVSSSNLTSAARFRQWNDLLTTRSSEVYDFLSRIVDEYAADTSLEDPFEARTLGDHRIWVFPAGDRNPQLSQLRKVRCHGATGRTGTPDGRTRIRVSVAGWFDVYGEDIAKRLRVLWDRGCDVRVVTTLAGRGINAALRATYGRGPVPMRRLAWDRNGDGVPDRYLHQKSMAVSGVFGDDTSATVVMTGSPNWSERAARSEEIWVRVLDRPALTRRYLTRVDRLFSSPSSSPRLTTRAELQRALRARAARAARVDGGTAQPRLPRWLELD